LQLAEAFTLVPACNGFQADQTLAAQDPQQLREQLIQTERFHLTNIE
jgi:hypothetical protein